MPAINIAALAIWFPAFLISITLHEAAHAATSLFYGDRTAEKQASLNPIPHIQQEPIGTLVVPLISFVWMGWMFGYASAPYDPYWADRNPRRAALMSAAGPLANLALAALALVALHILMAMDLMQYNPRSRFIIDLVIAPKGGLTFLAQFLSVVYGLNLLLGILNLLPLPPLDGSGVVRGLFPGSGAAKFLANMEERGWAMIGLVVAFLLFSRLMPYIWALIEFGVSA